MLDFNGEITNQLSLQRAGNGFQLVAADDVGINLKTANDMFFNFYIATKDGISRFMNDLNAITMGHSTTSAIGKSLFDCLSYESALESTNNNRAVEQSNKLLIAEETVDRKDFHSRCLSIKQPLYANHTIIGTVGCSIYFDRDSLAKSLNQIVNMGLLNQGSAISINNAVNDCPYNLTKREKECLYYSMKGKSAREIAILFKLSRRTIEQYFENIKFKMGVSTRSEMIERGWSVSL